MDERIKVFAHNLIHKSIQVKPGDKVYIDYIGESTEALARQLIKETYAVGAMPFPHYTNPRGSAGNAASLHRRTASLNG